MRADQGDHRFRPPVMAPVELFDEAEAPRGTLVSTFSVSQGDNQKNQAQVEQAVQAWRSDGVRAKASHFANDVEPPEFLRALNDPDMLPPDPDEPDDLQGIADLLLDRARDGSRLGRVFAHADYRRIDGQDGEAWARAIAEFFTGIVIADPTHFHPEGRLAITRALFIEGRVPLVALSQDAVTAALCVGGWDGGRHGDIGVGRVGLARCKELGDVFLPEDEPDLLRPFQDWNAALWDRFRTGACLFWAGSPSTTGRVAMVLRKRTDGAERTVQVWGTGDPSALVEGPMWTRIPEQIQTETNTLHFCGIGLLRGLGGVRGDFRPRGRCRLVLRQRSDSKLLYRSGWISMAPENFSIARLLCSLRNSPRAREIEATWHVHSLCLTPTADVPDNVFIAKASCGKWGRVELRYDPSDPVALAPGAHIDSNNENAMKARF